MSYTGNTNSAIILGGGLAGLTAGYYSGLPVYEADSRAGGVAGSDTGDGFVFDRGIHILQTRNTKVLELLAELGVDMDVCARQAFIYSYGRYTAYPFQVNTARLPLGLRLRCVAGFIGRRAQRSTVNYEEWMYRNLGRGFADTFLIPYSEKFWGVHPREMTHEWTGARVPQPNLWQVLRGAVWDRQTKIGTNATFLYPRGSGGYGAIADALFHRVPRVHLGHRATRIDAQRHRIQFNDDTEIDYDALLSTIPLPELVRTCVDAPQTVRAAAAQLRTNSIFVVNLGIARSNISDRHWVHFPERDVSFFRISYPHNFTPGVAPPGMSSISAEVSYPSDRSFDRQGMIERVIGDLRRVGAMRHDDPIVHTSTQDIRHAYCIYDQSRKAAVGAVRDWLKAHDISTAGRYGLWSYFWSDEAMMSGKKAAEKLVKRLHEPRACGPEALLPPEPVR